MRFPISDLRPLISVMAVLCLAGCAEETLPHVSVLLYPTQAPISLNIATIRVKERSPLIRAPSALRNAVEAWAQARFVASGGERKAVLILEEAGLSKQITPAKDPGFFKPDTYESYNGRLRAKLEILDASGIPTNTVVAEVHHTLRIPDTHSLAQKEEELQRMIEELINALDSQLSRKISEVLQAYL